MTLWFLNNLNFRAKIVTLEFLKFPQNFSVSNLGRKRKVWIFAPKWWIFSFGIIWIFPPKLWLSKLRKVWIFTPKLWFFHAKIMTFEFLNNLNFRAKIMTLELENNLNFRAKIVTLHWLEFSRNFFVHNFWTKNLIFLQCVSSIPYFKQCKKVCLAFPSGIFFVKTDNGFSLFFHSLTILEKPNKRGFLNSISAEKKAKTNFGKLEVEELSHVGFEPATKFSILLW
mgnify:CR=1 FL=1